MTTKLEMTVGNYVRSNTDQLRRSLRKWTGKQLGRLMDFALKHKEVQKVIVTHLRDGGLMCDELAHAVETEIESRDLQSSVDVESAIEEAMENIDASNIDGLDRALEDVQFNPDNIDGLDTAIEDAIENAIGQSEFDASQIKHLDRIVNEVIQNNSDQLVELVMQKLVQRLAS